eukprot:6942568-Prymnesium_polylepis.1
MKLNAGNPFSIYKLCWEHKPSVQYEQRAQSTPRLQSSTSGLQLQLQIHSTRPQRSASGCLVWAVRLRSAFSA